MNYAVVATKLDPQMKKDAQRTAKELGIPLSHVLKAAIRRFIWTKSVEFGARDEVPNEYFKSALKKAEENWRNGNTSPAFRTGKEAVDWLEKQGV